MVFRHHYKTTLSLNDTFFTLTINLSKESSYFLLTLKSRWNLWFVCLKASYLFLFVFHTNTAFIKILHWRHFSSRTFSVRSYRSRNSSDILSGCTAREMKTRNNECLLELLTLVLPFLSIIYLIRMHPVAANTFFF